MHLQRVQPTLPFPSARETPESAELRVQPPIDPAVREGRYRCGGRPIRRAPMLLLSALLHGAVLAGLMAFLHQRPEVLHALPETTLSMVFAPTEPLAVQENPPVEPPSQTEPEVAPAQQAAPAEEPPTPAPEQPEAVPIQPPVSVEPPLPPTTEPQSAQRPLEQAPAPPRPAPSQAAPARPRPVPTTRSAPAPYISAAPLPPAGAMTPARPVAGMESDRPPAYPESARRRGQQGRVLLRVEVAADGQPVSVAVATSSGVASLDSAALSAVQRWRFVPATRGGQPVPAVAEVPVRFQLTD